jgi:hypothetical protein
MYTIYLTFDLHFELSSRMNDDSKEITAAGAKMVIIAAGNFPHFLIGDFNTCRQV